MKKLIILFFLICYYVSPQRTVESKQNEIIQYLEKIKKEYNVPGMVVAISNKDGIAYLKSFGNVSVNDNFILGSNSKSFTALIILQLQEKGLLNINDPVVKYLPWFEYKNKEISNQVTLKNLLHHTSGQSTEIGRSFIDEKESEEDVRLKIIALLKSVEVDKYPIKDFDYSNLNYQLLGYIIEKVTGKEYSVVLKEEITDVLKLKNTSTVLPKNMAQGYQPFLYYSIIPITPNYNKIDMPSGFINSNAQDLSKYLRELMNSYNNDTTSLFSKKLTDRLFTPNDENNAGYALGWLNFDYYGTNIIFHDGLTQSFNSAMIIAPEIDKNIVVLTNHYGESAAALSFGVLSILLDKEPPKFPKVVYYIIRSLPFLVLLFLIVFLALFKKWIRKGKPTRISRKILPNILLVIGLIIALGWTFYVLRIFRASVSNMLEYDITSGISSILLTIFSLGIVLILYFNNVRNAFPNNLSKE